MDYNKRILYSNIDNKLSEFGIDLTWLPLDIKDLAKNAGIEIQYHSFESNSIGAVLYKDTCSGILVNKKKPPVDQRFDIAHEIIHYWFHPVSASFSFDSLEETRDKLKEWQANEGAAELLLPYKDFIPRFIQEIKFAEKNYEPPEYIYNSLACYYGVNSIVVDYRIRNLEDEILQYHSGIPIDKIVITQSKIRFNKNKELSVYKSLINKIYM